MAKTSARSRSSSRSKKSSKSIKKPARKSARKSPSRSTKSIERPGPLAALFPDLESELATTRRMLDRVPSGRNDWRPHARSRTLGELATHLAQLPGFGLMMATRNEFDGLAPRPPQPALTTNAERVQAFEELSAQLRAVLQKMTWDQANAPWKLRLGDKVVMNVPRTQVIRTVFVTHSAHHRAQLGVYLRMLEIPVPWCYGRSADEEPPAAP